MPGISSHLGEKEGVVCRHLPLGARNIRMAWARSTNQRSSIVCLLIACRRIRAVVWGLISTYAWGWLPAITVGGSKFVRLPHILCTIRWGFKVALSGTSFMLLNSATTSGETLVFRNCLCAVPCDPMCAPPIPLGTLGATVQCSTYSHRFGGAYFVGSPGPRAQS